jgi:hypothetical protein
MAGDRWQMADGRWRMADGMWQMADGRWQWQRTSIWHSQTVFITLTIKTDNTALHLEAVATEVEPRAPLVSYSGYCSVPYRASGEP